MSDDVCCFTKQNENGKTLKCRKKSVTADGYCRLHGDTSVELGVTEEDGLGISLYDRLVEGEIEDEVETRTTETQRKEVF